ncbi:MAG: hypothetical protein QW813_00775 [Candidatus Aenigmatarchaeota archaeon]
MVEERIVKINLRKQMKLVPKWKRKATFTRLLREKLGEKIKIDQKLNEKIWSDKNPKIRLKIIRDDNKVELAE